MFRWNEKGHLKIVFLIFVVFLLGVTIGLGRSNKSPSPAPSNNLYEELKVFTEVIGLLQKEYVEETKSRDLVYGAIKGMLETLDPHSAFYTPEMYKEMQEETKGRFEGLGIEITLKEGILTVVAPIEGTPASKAGILAGDLIVKIDGEPTKNLTLMDSVKRLRGPKGTKVTITIMREGFTKPKDVPLTRDVIPIRSVRYEVMENQYGYIRLSHFQDKTDSEFGKALKAVETDSKGPLKGLILDLRNNPGGLLDQAVKVSDRFVDSGVIVSIDGRREEQKMKFYAHAQGTMSRYPLVVLINNGSASGSEIVAGAIQDYGRGLLVGTQTFGKGSVQTIFPLKDGSGLRLTTAKYYTPNGRSIHNKGIAPDIVVEPPKPEEEKPATPNKEKEKAKKEEKKPPDLQLNRALELLKKGEVKK
jgi:carboxyl-terminal processing protease